MINLLPPEEKKELFFKAISKVIAVLGLAVLFFLFFLTIILVFVNFYITDEINQLKINFENNYEKKYSEYEVVENLIKRHNETLKKLSNFYENKIYFSDAVGVILEINMPEDVYFSELSLQKNEKKEIDANIYGTSKSREGLLIFKNNIEKQEKIKDVYFSPESWTSSQNVKFYLSFKINNEI